MERLTNPEIDYSAVGVVDEMRTGTIAGMLCRLAAYEDTGLSPEEIKELCTDEVAEIARMFRKMIHSGEIDHLIDLLKAEHEGRLVVLPCKVGDTVWFNTYKNNATECVGIQPHEVKRVNVYFLTDGAEIPEWEFGKTIFLSREEAEKALEVSENEPI